MTALSLMRLLPDNLARIKSGSVFMGEEDILKLHESQMRHVRGRKIGMIFQEPMTSLNPIMTIGRQIAEAVCNGRNLSLSQTRQACEKLLDQVQISDGKRRLDQYPHELSGGLRQRVMIAMALAQNPQILIADEPTTALDVTVQAQILALIRKIQLERGLSVILITHDMGVVAEMADHVLVMKNGSQVEYGHLREIFYAPKNPYTQMLLNAVPHLGAMAGTNRPKRAAAQITIEKKNHDLHPIVEVENLRIRFTLKGGIWKRSKWQIHAVEDLSFQLYPGETLALVGESGCGKSTTGKALLNLVPWSGTIRIDGQETRGLSRSTMRPILRNIAMIFQDPYASLDPRMRVGDLVGEPLIIHGIARGSHLQDRVEYLFHRVGLSSQHMHRFAHEFSGGQRQRIAIARALSLSPKIIIADESVAALDVSIQAQVLDLLQDIQNETGIAYLFISHDMAVVEQISHRVGVMRAGRLLEIGTRAQIFENPQSSYTRKLLDAVPIPDPDQIRRAFTPSDGELPNLIKPLGYVPQSYNRSEIEKGHFVWSA